MNDYRVYRSTREAFGTDLNDPADRTDSIVGIGLALAYVIVAGMFVVGWL